ncbi:hypothetical protein [Bacillus sp. FJAT-29814]|uniref:hypothetical protein n=1 Tax=Bacillus sp. FJAT-29814 TaxID=1729688 RepID=UPI000836DF48|nr:hypothetical protein [Bacillus sp. FJAT-29814]
MSIVEFIKKYCSYSYRGYVQEIFEMKEGLEDGIPIPEGFELLTDICRFPNYAIFVNKEEEAILLCEDYKYSLSIYDNSVVWEETIKEMREYFNGRYVIQWFSLVTIDAVDDLDLFYEGGNFLGGSKGFYYTNRFGNVFAEYEYSLEDIRKINRDLQIDKTPWYLIVEAGSENDVEDWIEQIQNPLFSSGDIEKVRSYLYANRKKE